jgi:hypothetical protein
MSQNLDVDRLDLCIIEFGKPLAKEGLNVQPMLAEGLYPSRIAQWEHTKSVANIRLATFFNGAGS